MYDDKNWYEAQLKALSNSNGGFRKYLSNVLEPGLSFVHGYLNDPAHAQDVAQETFITVWEKLPEFRNESAIGTWIFRIASNQCLRQIEKEKRMPGHRCPADRGENGAGSGGQNSLPLQINIRTE